MDARLIYLIVFAVLFIIAAWLQKKYCIICDASTAIPKPYSYARLQLLWWTFVVLASFITTTIASGQIPTLDSSTLILLGIGSLTTISARLTDISDTTNYNTASAVAGASAASASVSIPVVPATGTTPISAPPALLSKDLPSQGFWLDILSDKTGVSIHRFQAVVFNLVFGVWFICQSIKGLKGVTCKATDAMINGVIPVITSNNLILLGVSAGTYVALKTTENK